MLPSLAIIALGVQKLLPLIQQIYGNWGIINGNNTSLEEVIILLKQPDKNISDENEKQTFNWAKNIKFNNVFFEYESEKQKQKKIILKNISFHVNKGDKVGVVGRTGSGKSTLLDLIMMLLEPTRGNILIDGKQLNKNEISNWQKNIANVSQIFYLTDNTISENIAFNSFWEKIDLLKVKNAAKRAGIHHFIESLPENYNTLVGERGIRLSEANGKGLLLQELYIQNHLS